MSGLAKTLGVIAAGAVAVGVPTYIALQPGSVPTGHRVTFAFDPSPSASVVGYRIYYGGATNKLTNVVDLGEHTIATLENVQYPVHAVVTAYDANGNESRPSNGAGVLSFGVVERIFAQTNLDIASSNWADAFPVQSVTNPTDTLFYRLRIERQSNLKTYP